MQVSAKFSEQHLFPGSEVQLDISAAPHSLCAVSAVDKSTSFMAKPGNKLDMDQVFQDLSHFPIDANAVPLQSDPWEYCAKSEFTEQNLVVCCKNEAVNCGTSVSEQNGTMVKCQTCILEGLGLHFGRCTGGFSWFSSVLLIHIQSFLGSSHVYAFDTASLNSLQNFSLPLLCYLISDHK